MRGRRVILAGAVATAVGLVVAWPAAARQSSTREQGWAVRESLTNPDVPLYNTAKQKLLDGGQVFTYTIASRDPEFYCEVAPHYDFIFFEMSTAPTSRCPCVQAMGDDRAVRWLDGTMTQRPRVRLHHVRAQTLPLEPTIPSVQLDACASSPIYLSIGVLLVLRGGWGPGKKA